MATMDLSLAAIQTRTFDSASASTKTAYPPEHRLSGGALLEYLDRRRFAVVSTARPDGRPHGVVTGYHRVGDELWLPTMSSTVRARNVRSQPWVVLTVTEGDGGDDGHTMVMLEGSAHAVPATDAPADLRGRADWADEWLRLSPSRVLSYTNDSQ